MIDDVVKGAVEGFLGAILHRKSGQGAKPLEATSLVLRDEAGRGRAVLGIFNGGPCLSFHDVDGQCHSLFSLDADGMRISLWGWDDTTNCTLAMNGNEPALMFADARGIHRASLRLFSNGPTLQLADENGRVRAEFDLPEGQPIAFRLWDAAGNCTFSEPKPTEETGGVA